MSPQLRISGRPSFHAGHLPFQIDIDVPQRLRREIEQSLQRSLNITTTQPDEGRWVTIQVPNGTLRVDRTTFTPIQEAYYQASQLINRGEWPQAVEALRKVVDLNPDPLFLQGIYTMLGIAIYRMGDTEAAADAFREAIKLDENNHFAQLFLGTTLMLSNRFEDAISPFKKAAELDPSQSHVNFYLGHVYSKLGRTGEAIEAYEAEIRTHRQSREAYQDFAKLYVKLGDADASARERYYLKAIETYEKWIEVSPGDAEIRNLIGYLYSMIDRLDPAIEAFKKAIEADPNNVIALINLGTAYLATERNSEAKEIFERLASLDEEAMRERLARVSSNLDEAVRLSIGEINQKLGAAALKMYQAQDGANRDKSLLVEAGAALKAALRYLPDDIHSLNNLGVTYYLSARRPAAIRQFSQVLEIDPNNEEAATSLRVTEEELGKVRHWLGSKVYRLLEKSSKDKTPIYTEDVLDEIVEGFAKIHEGNEAADEADVFTSDDLLHSLLPLMESIPEMEAKADLAARIVQRSWLTPAQAAQLVDADLPSFLGYLHAVGAFLPELTGRRAEGEQDYMEASIEALRKILEQRPDNERARAELQALMERRLDERLLESGLLKEIKGPITDFAPYQNRTLLPVGDKPLSEIVIEGRR
jgi:tetratricopeptide (TPR) repeat protein